MRQGRYEVTACAEIAAGVFALSLRAPEIAREAYPGQFLNFKVEGEGYPLLRRPMGLSAIRGEEVEVIFRPVGIGTRWLAERRPGDRVDVLGPLGRGFPRDGTGPLILAGGGLGVAPLLPAGEEALRRGRPVTALFGFRTARESYGLDRLRQAGAEVHLATEDGSAGARGRASDLLAEALSRGAPGTVYACGPIGFLLAVKELAARYARAAYLAWEERMACGFGPCLGCSLGGRRVCREGPVFSAEEVAG